jgi:hypothetical protein
MIRQTSTGMEQQCTRCVRIGEPEEDTWHPLTEEFFPVLHPGKTRLVHYATQCKACREEMRQQQPSYVPPKRYHEDRV